MTATIDYHGIVRPMPDVVLSGPDADGRCGARVPLNAVLAVTYSSTGEIDQAIRALQGARVLLANHQADVDAAMAARKTRSAATRAWGAS